VAIDRTLGPEARIWTTPAQVGKVITALDIDAFASA
jgi:hypothetical protein